jgi:hypothetical protein
MVNMKTVERFGEKEEANLAIGAPGGGGGGGGTADEDSLEISSLMNPYSNRKKKKSYIHYLCW